MDSVANRKIKFDIDGEKLSNLKNREKIEKKK